MLFTRSAGRHGIGEVDVRQVLAAPLRTVLQGELVLHIGLTARRDLVEVVVAPGDPVTVLHAMRLSRSHYRLLREASVSRSGPARSGQGRWRQPSHRSGPDQAACHEHTHNK